MPTAELAEYFTAERQGGFLLVALALLVEAAVLLAFDGFAHQRALVYTKWLQGLVS